MDLYVRLFDASIITLDVEPADTIDHVKSEVADRTGLSPALHILVHAGRVLDDTLMLMDYNIQKESTLLMLPTNGVITYADLGITPAVGSGSQLLLLSSGGTASQRVGGLVAGTTYRFGLWAQGDLGWSVIFRDGADIEVGIFGGSIDEPGPGLSEWSTTFAAPAPAVAAVVAFVATGDLVLIDQVHLTG